MNYEISSKFTDHLKNLKQVFFYIIDDCNLDCVQCLYKPNNRFHIKDNHISYDDCKMMIEDFYELGARKITFMGGEPTLYDLQNNNKNLFRLISYAKKYGYEYIRIDTNGQFSKEVLENEDFKLLDEITFSIDGYDEQTNDCIRGEGSFRKCLDKILYANTLGYKTNITCCIHKELIKKSPDGRYNIEKMISFAIDSGVETINFHDLFKMNIPRDTWSGNIGVTNNEWSSVLPDILEQIEKYRSKISIRLPYNFVPKDEFDSNCEYYGYCSAKLGDRILVHPDGTMRMCSLMIGTPYFCAKYFEGKILWEEGANNELINHQLSVDTPCTHQYHNGNFDEFVPICVSLKPRQKEYVWQHKLDWESKFIEEKK